MRAIQGLRVVLRGIFGMQDLMIHCGFLGFQMHTQETCDMKMQTHNRSASDGSIVTTATLKHSARILQNEKEEFLKEVSIAPKHTIWARAWNRSRICVACSETSNTSLRGLAATVPAHSMLSSACPPPAAVSFMRRTSGSWCMKPYAVVFVCVRV